MATNSGARRGPQKYPDELRERAVRTVLEIRRETGESHGVVARWLGSWVWGPSR
jgi:transposase-like protein